MRLLNNVTKSLISAVLSCSLLIVWTSGTNERSNLGFTDTSTLANHFRVVPTNSIWDEMGDDFELDHRTDSAQVQAEIRKLQADHGKLYHILESAGPYIYFIYKQTHDRGLPAELALIPVIESEYNPNDHSTKGATGLWQLMPATAHELGVSIKSGYDGRRDVVASTNAALAYFNDLGNCFKGNWYLAIAAYNCGQVRVANVERRTGSKSFWNLPLPQETKHYVPKLLAVAAIVKDPKKYGIVLPPISNKPYFTTLNLKKRMNLADVAKSTGVDVKILKTLNPDYKNEVVAKKEGYTLLVPIKNANLQQKNIILSKNP